MRACAGDLGSPLRLALTLGRARGVLGMALHLLRPGGVYELEVHERGNDDILALLSLRCLGDAEYESDALPPPPVLLLQVEVTARESQEALVTDANEVMRTLVEGRGSVRPGDLFEVELLVGACDDDGASIMPNVRTNLTLSGPGQPGPRLGHGALMTCGELAHEETETDAAAAALEQCARRMLRGQVALSHTPSASLRLPALGASDNWRVQLVCCVRVLRLAVAPSWIQPNLRVGVGDSGGASAFGTVGGGGNVVLKRCLAPCDLARLETSVLAAFGIGLQSHQPVVDDSTVELRAGVFELPAPATRPADAGAACEAAAAVVVTLQVVVGACELGAAWEPLLSSLAFRGELSVFVASGFTARMLRDGLAEAATAAGAYPHSNVSDAEGCKVGEPAEVAIRLHEEWQRSLQVRAEADAAALAACGALQLGVQVVSIVAPPDKREAAAAVQLGYVHALRWRAARLFRVGQPTLSARKWRRLMWTILDLPAIQTFQPDSAVDELLAAQPVVYSRVLRVGAVGAPDEATLGELYRTALLGLTACGLQQGNVKLAQAACHRVLAQRPSCADAHLRLAHALYAERHLDAAIDSLCRANQLRPVHAKARALHAHISHLRSLLRARACAKLRAA